MNRKWAVFFGVAAGWVVLDQVTKLAVVRYFDGVEGARKVVVRGFFDLILARNPGAAFSMLANLEPEALRIAFFVLVSSFAVVLVTVLARAAKPEQKLQVLALSLVLGGALGNLIDRVLAGKVVDFLEFYSRARWMTDLLECSRSRGCRFAAFNVADIGISVGVGLLILDALLSARQKPAGTEDSVTPPPPPPGDGTHLLS